MAGTRKIATIVVTDVVGHSRLAGADEDRTLPRLRGLRSDLIDPTIDAHHGRIVKRTGDGSLIEFRRLVDAVRCAIEVQNGIIERNAGVAPERRIEFRVGIHLGDVVEEPDEATNSGSLREPNSNPRRERQSDSGARRLAGVWSRLVINWPLGAYLPRLIALSQVRPCLVAARSSRRDSVPGFGRRPRRPDAFRPLSFFGAARAWASPLPFGDWAGRQYPNSWTARGAPRGRALFRMTSAGKSGDCSGKRIR